MTTLAHSGAMRNSGYPVVAAVDDRASCAAGMFSAVLGVLDGPESCVKAELPDSRFSPAISPSKFHFTLRRIVLESGNNAKPLVTVRARSLI